MLFTAVLPSLLFSLPMLVRAGATISDPSHPPASSESGQTGYNDCARRGDSPDAMCQTSYINSLSDFCLFAPPETANIGDSETREVAYCTAAGHGARLMPSGTITGAHLISTPHYIQITGKGDLTKLNIARGDMGGELDPHGANQDKGNPVGGLLLGQYGGQTVQFTEWTQFISDSQFCIRACFPGNEAARYCEHIYDTMGCAWNMPGNYVDGEFDTCGSDDVAEPMGVYKLSNGDLSTWYQGVSPTPSAQRAAPTSSCHASASIRGASY